MRVAIPPCEGVDPNWHIDSKTMDLKRVESTYLQLEPHQLAGDGRVGQMLLCREASGVDGSLEAAQTPCGEGV